MKKPTMGPNWMYYMKTPGEFKRLARDAETLRLIVKHRMAVVPPTNNCARWWIAMPGVAGFTKEASLHTAVRRAAKEAR